MNCYYGISLVGSSHISRGIVCQDANKIAKMQNGWIVAAIADGVGSARHSDIASSIAVETTVDFCVANSKMDMSVDALKKIIFDSYVLALTHIEARAEADNNPITEYDTTLTMVIYDGKKIVYGHSGDGGIIGLGKDGNYKKITTPQKAADGICVIPLRAGENSWCIGHEDGEFVSVILATDGVYDIFFPYLLRGQKSEVYIPLIRYFADNDILNISDETAELIKREREDFLCSSACAGITDDKTVVAIINTSESKSILPDEYYAEPDWNYLQEEWNKKAYPHLYKKI